MDMSQVIIPKSDQINADDMIAGPMTFTIRDVRITPGSEQPVSIVLDGTDKFYRPCKSMSRVLVGAWGADAKAYIGRSLTLYRDPEVKWGGLAVGGIRISHMSDLDGVKTMVLTASKGSRKPHKVLPLENAPKTAAEDKALAWADKLIATINTSAPDEVAALTAKHAATLEKMKTERPELYERVIAATVPVESDPFADDDAPDTRQIVAQSYVTDFGKLDDIAAIEALWTKSATDRASLPAPLSASVEAAYEAAKARVSEGVA